MLTLDNLPTETADKPPANSSPLTPLNGHFPNEFDWATRECENLNISDPSLGFTPGSCNPTKEGESSISLSTGGCDSQGTLGKDTDEDDPMTSPLKSQTPVCDFGERMNPGRSHGLPPHDLPFDTIQECSNEMEVGNTKGDAHQCVTNNVCSGLAAAETRVHNPNPGLSLPYLTPNSNPSDTPTPPSRGVVRSAEATSSDTRTPNNIWSGKSFSRLQPTVEDALGNTGSGTPHDSSANDDGLRGSPPESDILSPNNIQSGQSLSELQPTIEDSRDDTDSATPDYLSANDGNFREPEIESAIDDALGFLQDTSSGIENFPPGDKKSMGRESNRSTSVSASSSDNDQPELRHEEDADRSSVRSGCETSQVLYHKRKFSAIESSLVQPSRNLRPRPSDKRRDGNQSYDNRTVEEARKTSVLEAAVPRSTAGVAHSKTRVPSKSEKNKWKDCFSCHPSLSDLPPDKKDEIERKCKHILRPDLPDFLETHTKSWKSSGFWCSPSLDVSQHPYYTPTNTRAFAIWKYVEAMQADEATYYLKSRLADIMIYLEYIRELNRQKKAGHPGQTAKTRATDIICGTGSLPKVVADKTRRSFHEHKLVGERWWWCGCYLGRGLFLLCSPETGKKM